MDISVTLALRRPDQLRQFLKDLQDPASPSYHQWLTPDRFDVRFGPSSEAIAAVYLWLANSGMEVESYDRKTHSITARATAAIIERIFDTEIQTDGQSFTNVADPLIPIALSSIISNIEGLSDIDDALSESIEAPNQDIVFEQHETFSPTDFRVFNDEMPLLKAGIQGTTAPDCIAVVAPSDVQNSVINAFTSRFRLPAVNLTRVFPDLLSPGIGVGQGETALDLEYSHVVAPSTPIKIYEGAGITPLRDALASAVQQNVCGAINISYGVCDKPSSFFTATINQLFQQAAAQGQTVFVPTGDNGADECGLNYPNVNELAADDNVVAVGGTEFDPLFDSKGNDTSVVGVGPDGNEFVWNDGAERTTGGGMSQDFERPTWQGSANINGTTRLVPDVSLGASGEHPGYLVVSFDPVLSVDTLQIGAGTSLASPAWAGISRLLAQVAGTSRLGSIGSQIWQLGGVGFFDVTSGNNSVGSVTGYDAGFGYDLCTGWGAPDIAAFVAGFLSGGTATALPASVTVGRRQSVPAGTLILQNSSSSPVFVDSVKLNLSMPSIFRLLTLVLPSSPSSLGGQIAESKSTKTAFFRFNPSVQIPIGGSISLELSVQSSQGRGIVAGGSRESVQTVNQFEVTATELGQNVTFSGLPLQLSTVTFRP